MIIIATIGPSTRNKNVVKAIVISDPAAIHDLGEWYEFELNKYKSNESR